MNGIAKYLLDTNILIGMLNRQPDTLILLRDHNATTGNSGYSVITRIELLGFPKITPQDIQTTEGLLATIVRYPLITAIEDRAIQLRRSAQFKLPDIIILATAQIHGLQLLTLDQRLAAWADQF